ncbi:hypothetical protein NODU109028_03325 [Nocardioides dubius]|uniref:DUF998 domain-containing protein n=1 Tax=Nocardioides dubius TaxID=317019 RepID=A0ABN1TLE9_9ACTN
MDEATPATPRPVPRGALIGVGALGALLVACACAGGAELGFYWDGLRLAVLDPDRAAALGYTGDGGRCGGRPHGITTEQSSLLFFVGFAGTAVLLAIYLSVAQRCRVVAPAWLGTALVAGPAALGFGWHATAWNQPAEHDDWNLAEWGLYHAAVWLSVLLLGTFVVALLGWLRARRRDLPHDHRDGSASLRS